MIDQTHWLGALIGSYHVIGTETTPVRELIDRAAAKIKVPVACMALVVTDEGVSGLYFGGARAAWKCAAALSAEKHIEWVEQPFRRALAMMPEMYADIWTAAKGMYKAEPAMMDEGEVVVYAPHITEFSYTHGAQIEKIGYHCRDYFVKQWKHFADVPRGVLAHSTHLRGEGAFDLSTGFETRPDPRDAGHGHFRGALPSNESRLPGSERRKAKGMDGARSRRNQTYATRRGNSLSAKAILAAFLKPNQFSEMEIYAQSGLRGLLRRFGVIALAIDRGNLPAHRAQVRGQLPTMVNGVMQGKVEPGNRWQLKNAPKIQGFSEMFSQKDWGTAQNSCRTILHTSRPLAPVFAQSRAGEWVQNQMHRLQWRCRSALRRPRCATQFPWRFSHEGQAGNRDWMAGWLQSRLA